MEHWACHFCAHTLEQALIKVPDSLHDDLVRGDLLLDGVEVVPGILPGIVSCTVGKLALSISWDLPRKFKVELVNVHLVLGSECDVVNAVTLPHMSLPDRLWRDAFSSLFCGLELDISQLRVQFQLPGQLEVGLTIEQVAFHPAEPRRSLCQVFCCGAAADPNLSYQEGSVVGLTIYTQPEMFDPVSSDRQWGSGVPEGATAIWQPLSADLWMTLTKDINCGLEVSCTLTVAESLKITLSQQQLQLLVEVKGKLFETLQRWRLNIMAGAGRSNELDPSRSLLESLLAEADLIDGEPTGEYSSGVLSSWQLTTDFPSIDLQLSRDSASMQMAMQQVQVTVGNDGFAFSVRCMTWHTLNGTDQSAVPVLLSAVPSSSSDPWLNIQVKGPGPQVQVVAGAAAVWYDIEDCLAPLAALEPFMLSVLLSWARGLVQRVSQNYEQQLAIPTLKMKLTKPRMVLLGSLQEDTTLRACSMVGCKKIKITTEVGGWAAGVLSDPAARSVSGVQSTSCHQIATEALILVDEFNTVNKLFCSHAVGGFDIETEIRLRMESRNIEQTVESMTDLQQQDQTNSSSKPVSSPAESPEEFITRSDQCGSPGLHIPSLAGTPDSAEFQILRKCLDHESELSHSRDAVITLDIKIQKLVIELDGSVGLLLLNRIQQAANIAVFSSRTMSMAVHIDQIACVLIHPQMGQFQFSSASSEMWLQLRALIEPKQAVLLDLHTDNLAETLQKAITKGDLAGIMETQKAIAKAKLDQELQLQAERDDEAGPPELVISGCLSGMLVRLVHEDWDEEAEEIQVPSVMITYDTKEYCVCLSTSDAIKFNVGRRKRWVMLGIMTQILQHSLPFSVNCQIECVLWGEHPLDRGSNDIIPLVVFKIDDFSFFASQGWTIGCLKVLSASNIHDSLIETGPLLITSDITNLVVDADSIRFQGDSCSMWILRNLFQQAANCTGANSKPAQPTVSFTLRSSEVEIEVTHDTSNDVQIVVSSDWYFKCQSLTGDHLSLLSNDQCEQTCTMQYTCKMDVASISMPISKQHAINDVLHQVVQPFLLEVHLTVPQDKLLNTCTRVSLRGESHNDMHNLHFQLTASQLHSLHQLLQGSLDCNNIEMSWPSCGHMLPPLCLLNHQPTQSQLTSGVVSIELSGIVGQLLIGGGQTELEPALRVAISNADMNLSHSNDVSKLSCALMARLDCYNSSMQSWVPMVEPAAICLSHHAWKDELHQLDKPLPPLWPWHMLTEGTAVSPVTVNLSSAIFNMLRKVQNSTRSNQPEAINQNQPESLDEAVTSFSVINQLGCIISTSQYENEEPFDIVPGSVHHIGALAEGFYLHIPWMQEDVGMYVYKPMYVVLGKNPPLKQTFEVEKHDMKYMIVCDATGNKLNDKQLKHTFVVRSAVQVRNNSSGNIILDFPSTVGHSSACITVDAYSVGAFPLPLLIRASQVHKELHQESVNIFPVLKTISFAILPGNRVAGVDHGQLSSLIKSPRLYTSRYKGAHSYFVVELDESSGSDGTINVWAPITIKNNTNMIIEVSVGNTSVAVAEGAATPITSVSPEFNDSDNLGVELMLRAADGVEVKELECSCDKSISLPLSTPTRRFLISAHVKQLFEKSTVGVRGTKYIRVTEVILSCQYSIQNHTNVPLHITCPGVEALIPSRKEHADQHENHGSPVQEYYQMGRVCEFSSPIHEPDLDISVWTVTLQEPNGTAGLAQTVKLSAASTSHTLALVQADSRTLYLNCHVKRTELKWGGQSTVVMSICPYATLCNQSNFRLIAEVGKENQKQSLRQHQVIAVYQQELRVKPDLRNAARWSWTMPLRLDQPPTTLKCQKMDGDQCTYFGCECVYVPQAPHWRISTLSATHQSMVVIVNETTMKVSICQSGFEEEWHKHRIPAQGNGMYGWEHDAPPRELCIFFGTDDMPVLMSLDSDNTLSVCLCCHRGENPSDHDCAENQYYISTYIDDRQRIVSVSAYKARTVRPHAENEEAVMNDSHIEALSQTKFNVGEMHICLLEFAPNLETKEIMHVLLTNIEASLWDEVCQLCIQTVEAIEFISDKPQVVLRPIVQGNEPGTAALIIQGDISTDTAGMPGADEFSNSASVLSFQDLRIKVAELQLAADEQLLLRLRKLLGPGWQLLNVLTSHILLGKLTLRDMSLLLHLQWAEAVEDTETVHNRLNSFHLLRGRKMDQTKARSVHLQELTWFDTGGPPSALLENLLTTIQGTAIEEFSSTSDQVPAQPMEPDMQALREPRKSLPNGALHTYWSQDLSNEALRLLSRGGLFGRFDHCVLSHVHQNQQLFVTAVLDTEQYEYILVSDLDTNDVLWEVACADIVDINNCWGEALQVLIEGTESVLTLEGVTCVEQVASPTTMNLFICDDVVQLEALHNLLKYVKLKASNH